MKITLILLGIIIYLIVARVVINWLYEIDVIEFSVADVEWQKAWTMLFLPFILIWIGIRELANWISDGLF